MRWDTTHTGRQAEVQGDPKTSERVFSMVGRVDLTGPCEAASMLALHDMKSVLPRELPGRILWNSLAFGSGSALPGLPCLDRPTIHRARPSPRPSSFLRDVRPLAVPLLPFRPRHRATAMQRLRSIADAH